MSILGTEIFPDMVIVLPIASSQKLLVADAEEFVMKAANKMGSMT